MTHSDLKWVRENAGLTQNQAASMMEVDRRTFSRWETGVVKMPPVKWNRFLTLTKTAPAEIPKHLKYDSRGYPEGFDLEPFDGDINAEEEALALIEGSDHAFRERERARIVFSGLGSTPESIARDMALWDAETERIKSGNDLAG